MDLEKHEREMLDGGKEKEGKIENAKTKTENSGYAEDEKKKKGRKDFQEEEKKKKKEDGKGRDADDGKEKKREAGNEVTKKATEGDKAETKEEEKKKEAEIDQEKKRTGGPEKKGNEVENTRENKKEMMMKKATEENETKFIAEEEKKKKKEAEISGKVKAAVGAEKKENEEIKTEEEKKDKKDKSEINAEEEKKKEVEKIEEKTKAILGTEKKENEGIKTEDEEKKIKKTAEDNKEKETNVEEEKKKYGAIIDQEKTKAIGTGKKENEAANMEEKEKKENGVDEEKEVKATEMDKGNEAKEEGKKKNETIGVEEKSENKMEDKKTGIETDGKKEKEAETGEVQEVEKRCPYDLKENEKKALFELRSKLEEAILEGKMLKKNKNDNTASEKKPEEKTVVKSEDQELTEKPAEKEESQNLEEKEKLAEEETKKDGKLAEEQVTSVEVDKEISLWGVPLLPSKEDEGTDTILLKFLKARDFRVNDALEMLKKTLQWRRENKIDSIIDEDSGEEEFSRFAFMGGEDREGQPICYNVFGVFAEDGTLEKLLSNEEKKNKFLRWRVQLMERGITKLNWKPGGVSTMLQISDLNNTPLPSRKDLRVFIRQVVGVLQDNYPELVSRNVFLNVPFWYYAYTAILSPYSTQRTKSKFVFARPAKAHETLHKYVSAEQIPIQFGGLKQENDSEFSVKDAATEVMIKSGSVETIEIPAPEAGKTVVWELSVSGGEVSYREEFVPADENSYTIIVKKNTKMGVQEGLIRDSFKNSEPGKIVVVIDNTSFKKKRVLYRYKTVG